MTKITYFHAQFIKLIPRLEDRRLAIVTFGIFSLIICAYLPMLVHRADISDAKCNHTVPTVGDDSSYTISACNLLHGFGFADSISLALETYHLDLTTPAGEEYRQTYASKGPERPFYYFYRAPGFPLMLAAVYAIFGSETIVARRLLAVLLWLTALFLLAIGAYMAGWLGALAGGITALYHLNFFGDPDIRSFERILTETPTAFWVVLFCLLFVIYLNRRTVPLLIISSMSCTWIIFTRSNFVFLLPFLVLFLYLRHRNLREVVLLSAIVIVPVILWSGYASYTKGHMILFTTQGEIAFPQFNNRDVLEGVGPQHAFQGSWNPGFELDSNGNFVPLTSYRNIAGPGENGWIKGLRFWKDNVAQLPRLFYLKFWRNFWYDAGDIYNGVPANGIYLVSIGFLLLTIGLRPGKPLILHRLSSRYVILLQCFLVALLFVLWNIYPFWSILLVWTIILTIAVLCPCGDFYQLPFVSPAWFLAFVAGQAIVTILFGDPRFHQPLDSVLMLFGILGTFLLLYELVKRSLSLMLLFSVVVIGTLLSRFGSPGVLMSLGRSLVSEWFPAGNRL